MGCCWNKDKKTKVESVRRQPKELYSLYSLYMTGDRFSWEVCIEVCSTFRDDKTLFPLPWESGNAGP
jgi:hypothetical protein